jgi:starvation-inducible outer membrane lipoprotein
MSKQILKPLQDLIYSTEMTFEESKGFIDAISNSPIEIQVELYRLFNYDTALIYPTYINYMAKKRAKETGIGWDEAVEAEVKFLDNYIEGRRVGAEIQ